VDYATLRSYMAVSAAFPSGPGNVARATHPWTVYRTFVTLKDREKLAGRSERWTVPEARELVRKRQPAADPSAAARAKPDLPVCDHQRVCKQCGASPEQGGPEPA